jgi:hypothetical protein
MRAVINRFWMPAAAVIALAYLVVMLVTGALPRHRHLIKFEAHGVMQLDPERITRVSVTADGTSTVFMRQTHCWVRDGSKEALEDSLTKALNLAVKFMHTANPVRVFKPEDIADTDPAEFGLDRPQLSITLADASGVVLEADFGNNSGDGLLQYMRLKNRNDLFMMSGFVGKEWETVARGAKP